MSYNPFSIVAIAICFLTAIHVFIAFDVILLAGFFILFSSYLFIKINKFNEINSACLSALIAGGVISFRYLFYVISGEMSNQFLIGDSDSLIYSNIASQISIAFSLFDQFTSLEHVQLAADQFGYLIPNRGMYWFLGIIYTIVGFESGPASFFVINVFSAMAISYYSVMIASRFTGASISSIHATVFSVLIFSISAVADHALHLRKDFLLIALLVSSLYYAFKRNYLIFAILAILAVQLRAVFTPIFILIFMLSYMQDSNWMRKFYKPRFFLILVSISIIAISLDIGGLIRGAGLSTLESNVSTLESLAVNLGGSAMFAYSSSLQWLYVLLYPSPPLSLNEYLRLESWDTLLTFLINVFLIFSIYLAAKRNEVSRYGGIFLIGLALYLILLVNLVGAASIQLIGLVEPRYKFSFWIFGGIFMLLNLSNSKSKSKSKSKNYN